VSANENGRARSPPRHAARLSSSSSNQKKHTQTTQAASSSSSSSAAAKAALATKLAQLDETVSTSIHDKVDALLDLKHSLKDGDDVFDYIVVGGGPGGISVAAALSADPATRVLLLEAGEDRDANPPIADSTFAWVLPVEYVPEYMWQMVSKPNKFEFDPDALPPSPGRRRRAQRRRVLLSASSGQPGRRHLLHGDMGSSGSEQYMGGRLLGGGTSINGEQVSVKSVCVCVCVEEGVVLSFGHAHYPPHSPPLPLTPTRPSGRPPAC
jgi:hypothetical protein